MRSRCDKNMSFVLERFLVYRNLLLEYRVRSFFVVGGFWGRGEGAGRS